MNSQQIESLRQIYSGPMTASEVDVLRDIQAFIDFAISNGLSFALVVGTLGHDVNNLARFGFDLERATADGFLPMVTGYSRMTPEDIGEPGNAPDQTRPWSLACSCKEGGSCLGSCRMTIERGQNYFVFLDPVFGKETGGYKTRPVVVISINDTHRKALPVTVVPGTSADSKPAQFRNVVLVQPTSENRLTAPTIFHCHQIRAIDQGRFTSVSIGRVSPQDPPPSKRP